MGKFTFSVSSDIQIDMGHAATGSVSVTRDGRPYDVQQIYVLPKQPLKVDSTLVHRVSCRLFQIIGESAEGYLLRDLQNETTLSVDFGTLQQSCWLLAEIQNESGQGSP